MKQTINNSHRIAIWATCLASAAGSSSWAQGTPEGTGGATPSLDGVTVTARRSLEQRFFAAGSLVVVDRSDIEQMGAFSVADVLRQLPGVQVTPSADGSVEIRMRGMERGATQLLIDGQRVGGKRTQLPIDQLPPELIERLRDLERQGLKQITFHPPFARRYEVMAQFSRAVIEKM